MKMLKLPWWLWFLVLFPLPWLWLKPGEVILAVDFPFPLAAKLATYRSMFPWDQTDNLGWIFGAQFFPTKLLIYGLHYLTELFRIHPEKVWLGLSLVLPAFSLGFLTHELLADLETSKRRVAALAAGFFATLNLYVLVQTLDQPMLLQLIFVPLIITFSFKVARGEYVRRNTLFAILTTLGLAVWNPASSAAGFLLIAIVWTRGLIRKYQTRDFAALRSFATFIAITVVGGLLLNAWWLVPFLATLQSFTISVAIPTTDWLIGTSTGTSLLNVVRLIGAWDWFATFNEQAYAPYSAAYIGFKPLAILAFVPAVLALIGWLKRPNRTLNLFALIAIFGIVLAAGAHPRTGPLYRFLFEHLPGFWLFRSPWYKFSLWIVIGFAPLIGWATVWLTDRLKTRLVPMVVIALFALLVHPLITGNRFPRPEPGRTLASHRYPIPDYVFATAQFLNSQPDQGRLLLLPQLFHDTSKYTWGYGSIRSPIYDLLKNRAIVYRFFGQQFDYTPLLDKLLQGLRTGNASQTRQVLDLLGIRYILNQQDFDLKFFKNEPSAEQLQSYLALFDGKQVFEADPWQVVEVGDGKLAQTLTGITVSDRYENLFEQLFPKDSAYVPALPDRLADRAGAMVRLTLDETAKTKGKLETEIKVPLAGSYRVVGDLDPNLDIDGQPLRANDTIELTSTHRLRISELQNPVALANSDFRSGLTGWQVQNLDFNPDKSIKRGVVAAQTEHGPAAQLIALGDWVAVFQRLPAAAATTAILSFDLNAPATGGRVEVAIDQPTQHKSFPLAVDIKPGWQRYDVLIDGALLKEPTDLYFYLYPSAGSTSSPQGSSGQAQKAELTNIALHRLTADNTIYLIKEPEPFVRAEIETTRLSPTKFKLEASQGGPMLIHLKEHYDPRWRLKADGFTAKPIKVNDATVAFYVDQPDLKQFTVEFTLEKWYRAGMAISVLTLLVLLIALRYSRD